MMPKNTRAFSLRFGIRTLFVAISVAALATLVGNYYWRSRPPQLQPYSAATLSASLAQGNPVIVTVDAKWALSARNRPKFMSPAVSRVVHDKQLVVLQADYTTRSPNVDQLMTKLNRSTVPTIALYSPRNPTSPIVLNEKATDQDIIDAIQTLSF